MRPSRAAIAPGREIRLACADLETREGPVRKMLISCGAVALLSTAASAQAARVDPFVITVDAHSYVSYAWPIVISPVEHLVQAPEARMSNCRREGGLPLSLGLNKLVYSLAGANLDGQTLRIEFHPTRVVIDTAFGDTVCDGAALTGETGLGRVFRDYFEHG
jgi:hypothetical protein